jgi:hypothetical protein
MWCILGGADYFQKVNAFNMIGCSRILEIVKAAAPESTKLVVPASVHAQYRPYEQARLFREFVLRGRGERVEASEASHRKKSCPTDAQIDIAFKEFQFLYKYWSVNWNKMPRLHEPTTTAATLYQQGFAARQAAPAAASSSSPPRPTRAESSPST